MILLHEQHNGGTISYPEKMAQFCMKGDNFYLLYFCIELSFVVKILTFRTVKICTYNFKIVLLNTNEIKANIQRIKFKILNTSEQFCLSGICFLLESVEFFVAFEQNIFWIYYVTRWESFIFQLICTGDSWTKNCTNLFYFYMLF